MGRLRGEGRPDPRAAASAASARIVLAGSAALIPATPAAYAVRSRNSRLVCAIPAGIFPPEAGRMSQFGYRLGEAAAQARCARLLAGAAVAVEGARLDSLVDARHQPAELLVRARGVAVADRILQPAEPGLHLGSAAPVLEALALRPMDPLFL